MSRTSKYEELKKILRAMFSNQIARFAPHFYVKITGQTGRGSEEQSVSEIAKYYYECFEDYLKILEIPHEKREDFLAGKTILEYGPGDTPGVAFLMLAFGAERVICVDEFPLYRRSEQAIATLSQLLNMLQEPFRSKGKNCFVKRGDPASGFLDSRFKYVVGRNCLSDLRNEADLIISRSVLEHVSDLEIIFKDMQEALRPNGLSVHKVDLRSHGLHEDNPLDFLAWPQWIWSLMYGNKGFINRRRIDCYRKILGEQCWSIKLIQPTTWADSSDVKEIRNFLVEPYSELSDKDLSCLGFWLVCTHEER